MNQMTENLTLLNGASWLLLDEETREELKAQAAGDERVLVKRYDPDTGESFMEEVG